MPFLIITFSGRIVKVVNNVCAKANKVFGTWSNLERLYTKITT